MTLPDLAPQWWWLLAAASLGIMELLLPGIFLVWIAAAAALTGLLLFMVALPLTYQLVVFAMLALAAVYAGRLYYDRNPVPSSDPKLNDRAARLVGETVTVESAIAGGRGRVRVGDGVWNARGPDAPAGTRMVVMGAEGTVLIVEPGPEV
jgi:membrane protein implicated in regulation of membrane protease activity